MKTQTQQKTGIEGLIEKINNSDSLALWSVKLNDPDGQISLGCLHVQVCCLTTSFSKTPVFSIGIGRLSLTDFVYDQDLKDGRYKRFKSKKSAIEYLKTIAK